jgi:hypothetical protein
MTSSVTFICKATVTIDYMDICNIHNLRSIAFLAEGHPGPVTLSIAGSSRVFSVEGILEG